MLIAAASPSLLGSIGESVSIAKGIAAAAQGSSGNELLAALLTDLTNKETVKEARPELTSKDAAAAKAQLLGTIQAAAAVLDQKATPVEAAGIKSWLYQLAVGAANATKEGGFLGIGAVRVSDAEKAALADLAGVLGVTPEASAAE
jgi:hypothetical protein